MKDQNQHKSVAKKWWWVMSATIFALLAVLTAILIEGQIIGLVTMRKIRRWCMLKSSRICYRKKQRS